jgi:hypothetical protein
MKRLIVSLLFLSALALGVGCSSSKETPAAGGAPTTPPPPPPGPPGSGVKSGGPAGPKEPVRPKGVE